MAAETVKLSVKRRWPLGEAMRKQSVLLARDIANHISDQQLEVGTRLATELDMVAQFGVGRNTVREALRLLELRGVITIRSGRGGGPVVRRPQAADLGDALQLVLQFQQSTLADVMTARLIVEPLAAAASATTITEAGRERLQKSVSLMLADLEDGSTFRAQNYVFHSVIGSCLETPVIGVFLESLKSVQDGVAFGVHYDATRRKRVAMAHQKIIAAIDTGEPDLAAGAMRGHLDEARKYWASRFPQITDAPLRWMGS